MDANDRAEEPVFFSPGVRFSFPLALIAGNRASLENALRRDIELARAVAAGDAVLDRGDAAPLVGLARQIVAAPAAWRRSDHRLKTSNAPQSSSPASSVRHTAPFAGNVDIATAPTAATELDALIERRRNLEESIRRARDVLSSGPNTLLESVCEQAADALVHVRAQIEAELAAVPRRAREERGANELEERKPPVSDRDEPRLASEVRLREPDELVAGRVPDNANGVRAVGGYDGPLR